MTLMTMTLVVDPEDSASGAAAVTSLACLPQGRVVCHPTPGGSSTWLACDLLLALGKRFDALQAEHVRTQAWDLAAIWLRAEAVEHLFVLRAHGLQAGALERLRVLQVGTGIHLWLVSSCAGVTVAQRQVLRTVQFETVSREVFVRRWHRRRAAPAGHRREPALAAAAFPHVPGVDFAVFRAMSRRVLDPSSFAVVDRTFAAALTETLRWLRTQRVRREYFRTMEVELDELDAKLPRTHSDLERRAQRRQELDQAWYRFEREARSQLQALTAGSTAPAETLVRLRAAQAAYFRFGLLLEVDVPPQALRGAAEFGPACGATFADRLRGLCTPRLAAAVALALTLNLGPDALASLRVGEFTSAGTALELPDGERRVLPVPTVPLVRAQLIQRRDQGAAEDAPLFCRRDGTPDDAPTLRRLLQRVGRRLAIAIPSLHSPAVVGVSWPVGHRLMLTRLPVYPLVARQWTQWRSD